MKSLSPVHLTAPLVPTRCRFRLAVGDIVTFECQIDASLVDSATITWSRDGLTLREDRRIKCRLSSDGKVRLTLIQIVEGDEGLYAVLVEHPDGVSASCQATLSVTNIKMRPSESGDRTEGSRDDPFLCSVLVIRR